MKSVVSCVWSIVPLTLGVFNESSGTLRLDAARQFFQSCGSLESIFSKLIDVSNNMLVQRVEMNDSVYHNFKYTWSGLAKNERCGRHVIEATMAYS